MTDTLRLQRDTLALEAFSFSDLQAAVRRVFPSMVKTLKGTFGLLPNSAPAIKFTSDQRGFIKTLEGTNYLDLVDMPWTAPEGLKVDYLTYQDALDAAVNHSVEVIDKVLTPFATYLGKLISASDRKFDTVGIFQDMAKREEQRQAVVAAIEKCFDNTEKEITAYGKIVKRNADWDQIFKNLNYESTTMNRLDRRVINNKIAELVELCETVIKKVERGELEGVSPETVKSLGDGVYQAAKELEFFAATHYRVINLVTTTDYSMSDVTKMLKKKK